MGKKVKGGRRQILQLEDKKSTLKPSKSQTKQLIHYSDSDEDSKKSSECKDNSEHSIGTVNKETCPLDTQVADFFKEINALAVNEDSSDTQDKSGTAENELKEIRESPIPESRLEINDPEIPDNNSNVPTEAYCPWQEICDDTTGYSYYWNVDTNAVTWDCPKEYALYLDSANILYETNSTDKNVVKLDKKKNTEQKEGSIIPISYYGESSSSEDEVSNEVKIEQFQHDSKRIGRVVTGKNCKSKICKQSKQNVQKISSTEIIGPQLPPDFQFPQDVPIDVELTKDTSDKIKKTMKNDINKTKANESVMADLEFNISPESSKSASTSMEFISDEVSCDKTSTSRIKIKKESHEFIPEQCNVRQTSVNRLGLEYDSFTDEDEEPTSNIKIEPCFPVIEKCSKIGKTEKERTSAGLLQSQNQNIFGKRKDGFELSNEFVETNTSRKVKKLKSSNYVDIDSLFATHSSIQKFGFGFKEESKKDTQFSKENLDFSLMKKSKDYKPVAFIKSSNILDLNELNCSTSLGDTNEQSPLINLDPNYVKSTDFIQDESYLKKVEKGCNNSDAVELIATVIEDSKSSSVEGNKIVISSDNKVEEKDIYSDFEDDIDEIDKALCKAMEEKKALKALKDEKQSLEVSSEASKEIVNSGNFSIRTHVEIPNKDDILNLSSILVDKLTYLISHHSLTLLNNLLVQVQTRLTDWQASALDSIYFMARLQEVNQYMLQYEKGIVTGDWICQWDREGKRYYYTNTRTQQSQWTYPEDLCVKSSLTENSTPVVSELSTVTEAPIPKNLQTRNKNEHMESPYERDLEQSPPPPPPGVDSPPPPLPCDTPPHRTPPLPPDSSNTDLDFSIDMDLENSNDSDIHPIISNTAHYAPDHIQYESVASSSNERINDLVDVSVTSVISNTETHHKKPNLTQDFPTHVSSSIAENDTIWSVPVLPCKTEDGFESKTAASKNISPTMDSLLGVCNIPSSHHNMNNNSSQISVHPSSDSTAATNSANKVTSVAVPKKEKKKTKILSVLALKKKNIPSLVEKWQKIREQEKKNNLEQS